MRVEIDAIGLTAVILVSLAYVLFGCVFLFRKRPPKAEEAKRAPAATLGIVLQGMSFFLLWSSPRQQWWHFPPSSAGEVALAVAAIVLAYASCWLSVRAVRILGKQWTYTARLIKDTNSSRKAPTGWCAILSISECSVLILSTCLAFSRWWSGLAAVVLFLIGNRIRIRAEEQLLRESFGDQFEEYSRRVPAFIPRPWR